MRRLEYGLNVIPLSLCIAVLAFAISAQAETVRVSESNNGTEANTASFFPALSGDGRYVAFTSKSNNLVTGDNNEEWDIFVHDRETGKSTRVNVASDGTEANGYSRAGESAISGNGRFVVFDSAANNMVADDNNGTWDIFVHDRETGETIRASVASDGAEATGGSAWPEISADGRYVAFESLADNLVPDDSNGLRDVFVHDLVTGKTTRVNVASDGTEANAGNSHDWLWTWSNPVSENGRYVAFTSPASNLVAGDNNAAEDIFVHDLETGETTRVSVASDGTEGNQLSLLYDMSENGRYVLFSSAATNLTAEDNDCLG